jgi:ADP-heptose:LPS heptosyltransferase
MKNILLLQLNRLGDLVQTVPLLRRMRKENPESRIVLVALEGFSGILEECGYFDALIPIAQRDMEALGIPERQAAFPDLAPFNAHPEFRQAYDLIVNLTNDLGSAVICEKVPAARKLGRIHTYEGELRLLGPWAKYMFSMVSHRVDNLFNIVDIQMGIAGMAPSPEPRSLPVSEARKGEIEELLAAGGRRPGRKLIALQTAASELHRAWSLDNFSAAAQSLLANGYADIVLLGDAGERARAERLAGMIGMPIIDMTGKTSLLQLPAVLQACDLLISNDTGTIHVAAAVGTPTLGLYFSTAYYSETAPYGDNHVVLQVEIPCAPCQTSSRCPVQICREYLKPEAVHEAALWMLGDRKEPPGAYPNLSLYRSRFLSNGSLAYLPVRAENATAHFLSGLQGRLLWEGALGLERDPVLDELWRSVRGRKEWAGKRESLASALASLGGPFREGVNLAEKLRAEFESEAPMRERIIMLHENLARLGKSMAEASTAAGLCGSFLKFEMMDMDFATYPALAEILEEKYRMLAEWMDRFESTLARLSADSLPRRH